MKRNQKGVTLVEIIISIGLLVIIFSVAVFNLSGYRSEQKLKSSLDEVLTVTIDTQKRSITQEDGSVWGISFKNNSDGAEKYEVFKNYDSSNPVDSHLLSNGTKFSEPYSTVVFDNYYDVVFSALSGFAQENKIISIVSGGNPKVGDVIIHNNSLPIISRLEEKLIGYWHLDENTKAKDFFDATINGNSMKLYSGNNECLPFCNANYYSGSDCKAGSCFEFDRNNNIYAIKNLESSKSLSSFTIEGWIKLNQQLNKEAIISGYLDSDMKISGRFQAATRKPSFYTNPGGDLYASTALQLGQWYHLAYVYDRSVNKKYIYINSVLDKTGVIAGAVPPFTINNFEMGRSEKDNNKTLDGLLDEIRFYERALTQAEISAHYNDFR